MVRMVWQAPNTMRTSPTLKTLAKGSALVVIFHPRLEEALASVVEHGGRVTQEIFSYPGGRRFHFTEPSGNELSVCSDH